MAGIDINIDTDSLKLAANTAKKANDSISQAMTLINEVTENNDWQCARRDQINEFARNNRIAIGKLQSDAESFYNAIQITTDRFLEREQEVAKKSDKIDDLLSKISSIAPSIQPSAKTGSASGAVSISSLPDMGSSLENHSSGGGKHG